MTNSLLSLMEPVRVETVSWTFTLALVNFLWLGGLLGLFFLALARGVRRLSVQAEYAVLTAGMGLFPVVFAGLMVWFWQPANVPASRWPTEVPSSTVTQFDSFSPAMQPSREAFVPKHDEISTGKAWHQAIDRLRPWGVPLTIIYLLGVAGMSLRLFARLRRSHELCRRSTAVADESINSRLQAACRQLSLRRVPVLAVSSEIAIPAVVGLLRPLLVVPAILLTNLTAAEWEAILRHELIHIRRRDPLISLGQRVMEVLFFYQPCVWMISHRMNLTREQCCDQAVLNSGIATDVYVETLLHVAEWGLQSEGKPPLPGLAALYAVREPSELRQRISRILGEPMSHQVIRIQPRFWIALIAMGLVAFPVVAQLGRNFSSSSPSVNDPILATSGPHPSHSAFVDSIPGSRMVTMLDLSPENSLAANRVVSITGQTTGRVWGTDIYTSDSDIATAAVHAGLVQNGESASIVVYSVPSPEQFSGSSRFGVNSLGYGYWPSAIVLRRQRPALPPVGDAGPHDPTGSSLRSYTPWQNGRGQLSNERSEVVVTGRTTGPIWGTNLYTSDSDISTAAVHSGLVKNGEQATIVVTPVPSPHRFSGTTQNGVRSYEFGTYPRAFVLSRRDGPPSNTPAVPFHVSPPPMPKPSLSGVSIGTVQRLMVVGQVTGMVWGTDLYTTDSDLGTAAVHAGVLQPGEQKPVTVAIVKSPGKFEGSAKHGVVSRDWSSYPTAFVFLRDVQVTGPVATDSPLTTGIPFAVPVERPMDTPQQPDRPAMRLPVGVEIVVQVTGHTKGAVWGTGIYTADSDVGTAAVHAGLVKPDEPGFVILEFVESPDHYTGSTQNGITTQTRGKVIQGFRIRGINLSGIPR